MTAKKQIIHALDHLESPQILQILDYILLLKQERKIIGAETDRTHYLRVRKALKNIKADLSNEIINEREDR